MSGILIAVSAAAMALSSSATANDRSIRFEGDTAHIAYGDLDITSRQGRSQLVGRIRKAAERICANYDGGDLSFAQINQCNRALTASGIEQIQRIAAANAMAQAPDAGRIVPSKPRGVRQ